MWDISVSIRYTLSIQGIRVHTYVIFYVLAYVFYICNSCDNPYAFYICNSRDNPYAFYICNSCDNPYAFYICLSTSSGVSAVISLFVNTLIYAYRINNGSFCGFFALYRKKQFRKVLYGSRGVCEKDINGTLPG